MNKRYFNIARKLSFKSDYEPQKVGAIIVKGNRILGYGFNKNKTSPRSNNPFHTIHAELSAILNTQQENLLSCEIYVYRETKKGQLALSLPCKYCKKLLADVGIFIVHFTDSDGFKTITLGE